MHKHFLGLKGAVAGSALVLVSALPAHATFGYFEHGIGVQAEGLAGASIAYPKDTLALASNPASLFKIGNRFDVGADLFAPDRGAEIKGNAVAPDQSYDGSGVSTFLIPQIGYTRVLSDDWAVGIAVYGNGGMNTSYDNNPFARFGATGKAGVNLEQAFISPTVAYKIAEGHSIGVSLNIVYQLFKAEGVGIFTGFSSAPTKLSNRNTDHAWGAGVRVGYLGQWTPDLSVGAFWQSKSYSGAFKKYAGLFAGQGSFDVPSSYGIGASYKLTDALDVALDVQRIDYSGVDAVGNRLSQLFLGNPFGSDAGPGFGWRDVTAVKLGFNYAIAPQWQVRAGWGWGSQPVRHSETFLNTLAPGVVQHHLSAGGTWTSSGGTEVSASLTYAPKTTITGTGSIPPNFGGGEVNVHLSEVVAGLAVGWHL
ncbi:long-chain fatty acid transport protein [Rhizomicrobium palustre]|uniref:Long-chain fatty acid transport protein n=1 Tax=Rhizomicrobium palustre TaxID=189966 RepID=A0A846N3S7_9PROT|nr:outer membrane protein transport protein [Rhizomicrobium palustre]NIK89757.1 long-chain fatty acid transport protein [Rhizomicrobium palustre]